MKTRLDGLRILAVDDDRDMTEVVTVMLGYHGARVASATTAREALTRADEEHFDVILVDLVLPREDGFEFLRQLRQQERGAGRRAHVVAISGYCRREDRERTLAAGFELFLAKPVDADELVLAVSMAADGQAGAFAAARRDIA
jgi:CheY-like chemotaxis protein